VTAAEIAARLASRAVDVCSHLFPAGRVAGDEFEIGDTGGNPGRSLKININGRAGIWKDFATDEKGDLLDLWKAAKRLDTAAAMNEAATWLGSPPRPRAGMSGTNQTGDPIPSDAPTGHPKWGKPSARWCYRDEASAPWLVVYRYDYQRDGKPCKAFFQFDHRAKKWIEKNGHKLPDRRPLYGLDRLGTSDVVLCEGEKCADAIAGLGFATTSTLGGGGQVKHADFSPLKDRRVLIWPDNDEPGRIFAEKAAGMLREHGATVLLVPVPEGKPNAWDVADAVAEGWTSEELRAQLEMAEPFEEPEQTGRFRLLTDEDLERQPDLPDLIKGVLPAASTIVLAAQPSAGKTTLALEIAGDVACDLLFHGRPVTAGLVVFIVAEGASKLKFRRRAWREYRKASDSTNVRFITEPVNFADTSEVDELLGTLTKLERQPVLVVVDTLARCMLGGDENSAKDVGAFVRGCDRVRNATGAAVLIVHHTTKTGNAERGSGALRGAADTLVMMSREDDLITVTCEKQKDGSPFEPLHFRLKVIDLGNERSACVLDPVDAPNRRTDQEPAVLPKSRREVLEALGDAVDGATYSQWLRLAQETFRMSESTLTRAVKDLIAWNRVQKRGERYFLGKTYTHERS
jgi:hypothetical protein